MGCVRFGNDYMGASVADAAFGTKTTQDLVAYKEKKAAEKAAADKILAEKAEKKLADEIKAEKIKQENLHSTLLIEAERSKQNITKFLIPAAAGIVLLMLLKK